MGRDARGWPRLGRYVTLFAALGALFAAGVLLNPPSQPGEPNIFLSIANQRDVLGQVAINGILAVGMTLVILTAGIDLSVGSVLSLCTVVCAILLMQRGSAAPLRHAAAAVNAAILAFAAALAWVWGTRLLAAGRRKLALLVVLVLAGLTVGGLLWVRHHAGHGFSTVGVLLVVPLVGGLLGMMSGVIIARTRLQPFIVTLAMMITAYGLAKYIAGQGGQIHTIDRDAPGQPGAAPSFQQLGASILTVGRERLRGDRVHEVKLLPVPGLFLLGAWVVAAFILHRLPLGRYIYAVGGNEEAARLAGVPVQRVKVFVYTASGLLAGLAAVLYAAQYTQGKPDAGMGKELDAIAAVVIGGTSLMGGRGSILGTLVGVMIFGYLTNILQLRAVSTEIQDILKGVIIVGAAAVQSGDVLGGLRRLTRPRT